jgi:hypothetical protein
MTTKLTTHLRKERFDQIGEFDNFLGQLDMELHPLWNKAWIGQDQKAFEQILHDMGADLSYGYDFRVCLYRARTSNKVEYGVRVSFKERTDKWWVSNMMDASDIIRNTKCSIRATGMRESLPEDSPLFEVMVNVAAQSGFFEVPVIMVDEGDK